MKDLRFYLFRMPGFQAADTLLMRLMNSTKEVEGGLFQRIPSAPFTKLVTWVEEPNEAEYAALPVNYSIALSDSAYLNDFFDTCKKYDLKPFVVNHGDYAAPISVENGLVLRTSAYRSKLYKNEVIIPAFSEDIGAQHGHAPRKKSAVVPTIGFSGMVKLPSKFQECKYQIKLLRQWFRIRFFNASPASYQGLFYRRIAIKRIIESKLCEPLFYIRDSFGRSLKTINIDPEQSRKEFIDSIVNSDLALVIRGDGNYSLRFFEVLSLGRIPLFVDTDSPLPLEDEIDYDSFILRVAHKDIGRLPEIVADFWKNCSETEYIEMQQKARAAYETFLRCDVFYTKLFEDLQSSQSSP